MCAECHSLEDYMCLIYAERCRRRIRLPIGTLLIVLLRITEKKTFSIDDCLQRIRIGAPTLRIGVQDLVNALALQLDDVQTVIICTALTFGTPLGLGSHHSHSHS